MRVGNSRVDNSSTAALQRHCLGHDNVFDVLAFELRVRRQPAVLLCLLPRRFPRVSAIGAAVPCSILGALGADRRVCRVIHHTETEFARQPTPPAAPILTLNSKQAPRGLPHLP
jgi:hypothetical protein